MNGDGTGQTRLTNNTSNESWPHCSGAVFETTPPSSTITAPANNASIKGTTYSITGTATDGSGSGVNKVEVSTNGGATYSLATGTTSWSFSWTLPADGSYTIKTRAYDNQVNVETPGVGVTVTVDNTPPTVSSVASGSLTSSSAVISWTTIEGATSQVEYGTTTSYGSSTTLDATLVTSHSIPVSGLSASTLYHYRVKSKDAAGNETISADGTFTTSATADTTAHVISSVQATGVTASGATITWVTDEASDSKVDYGTTTSYGSVATDANAVTSHSVPLTGLLAGTTLTTK